MLLKNNLVNRLKKSIFKRNTRKLYLADLKDTKMWQESDLPNSPSSGKCYFIPNFFESLGKRSLFELLKQKNYIRVAVLGNLDCNRKLIDQLLVSFPELTIHSFSDPGNYVQPIKNYDTVILSSHRKDAIKNIHEMLNNLRFSGDLIVPNCHQEQLVLQTNQIEDAQPIVACAFPCAGTFRFINGFEYLLKKLGWNFFFYTPFIKNNRYANTLKTNPPKDPDEKSTDSAIYWRAKTLDYRECMLIHEYFTLSMMKDLDCKIVVLMRDPRDIINSFYWRMIEETSNRKDLLINIMNGLTRWLGNEPSRWPSLNKMLDIFLFALEDPNCYIVRFEDLHLHDFQVYRDLMHQLNLTPYPFVNLSEEDFKHAAYLGSFKHQTKGKIKRGTDQYGCPKKNELNGISCRKGVIGDWRSSFTKEAVDYFKSVSGDKLIRLGYEQSMDWHL